MELPGTLPEDFPRLARPFAGKFAIGILWFQLQMLLLVQFEAGSCCVFLLWELVGTRLIIRRQARLLAPS